MKTEANALATPLMDAKQDLIIDGLTKREHMAIEFTKALLSKDTFSINEIHSGAAVDLAVCGIEMADVLIRHLNETTPITDKEGEG